MLSHFTSLVQFHIFTFTLSLLVHVLLQTQTTPKIGRDIIPDILDPVLQPDPTLMNRAFWRQNTRIHFTRSALPLLIFDPILKSDAPPL